MVVVFPGQYESLQHLLEHDSILLVKGRADLRGRGEELQLRAVEITEPDLGDGGRPSPPAGRLVVDLTAQSCTGTVIATLKELLAAHKGSSPVQVRFHSSQGVAALRRRHLPGRTGRRPALRAPGAARLARPCVWRRSNPTTSSSIANPAGVPTPAG